MTILFILWPNRKKETPLNLFLRFVFRWDTKTIEGACKQEASPGAKYLPPPASPSQQWGQPAPCCAGWSWPHRRWGNLCAHCKFSTAVMSINSLRFFSGICTLASSYVNAIKEKPQSYSLRLGENQVSTSYQLLTSSQQVSPLDWAVQWDHSGVHAEIKIITVYVQCNYLFTLHIMHPPFWLDQMRISLLLSTLCPALFFLTWTCTLCVQMLFSSSFFSLLLQMRGILKVL